MLVKCICTNCAGHLEFEEESAGQKIKCPHCGFDTVLYLPGAEKAEAEVASLTHKLEMQRRLLLLAIVLVAAGAVVWAVYHWVLPVFSGLLPETESKVVPILISAFMCLMIPLLLAWLVFPFLWYFQTRRLIAAVQQLEENMRPQPAGEMPTTFISRSSVAEPEDAKKL